MQLLEKITPAGTILKLAEEHRQQPRFFISELQCEISGQRWVVGDISLSGLKVLQLPTAIGPVSGHLLTGTYRQSFTALIKHQDTEATGLVFVQTPELTQFLSQLLTLPPNDFMLKPSGAHELVFTSISGATDFTFVFNEQKQIFEYLIHWQDTYLRWQESTWLMSGKKQGSLIHWENQVDRSQLKFFQNLIENQDCFNESFKEWFKDTLTH